MHRSDEAAAVAERWQPDWTWWDLLWLVFLAGLALLPPRAEVHKQLILIALGVVQIFERPLIASWPRRGPALAVGVKLALATLLIAHTGEVAINSPYYPIFYVPIVTAALFFGPWGTLGWTALTTALYCSYLWPALEQYSLDPNGIEQLALRNLFFFLVAVLLNRIVLETRRQRDLYRFTAERLEIANRDLLHAQAEAQRAERLAALGHLSAGLAHEIRNPLAVIKGSAEMLEKAVGTANPLATEMAGYISGEVNRVNALISRFLDFARPGQLAREPQPLVPLLERGLREAAERWPRAPVRVERAYAATLPLLSLDAALIERVFANLAANAYEAMGEAGGVLRVAAVAGERHGRQGVIATVFDSGPGIPAELREAVFNPFVTTKPTGVGLGLAIVAKIVDQHGGHLRLLAPAPTGTAFEVFLPE